MPRKMSVCSCAAIPGGAVLGLVAHPSWPLFAILFALVVAVVAAVWFLGVQFARFSPAVRRDVIRLVEALKGGRAGAE